MTDIRAIAPHVWGTFLVLVSLGMAIWIGSAWLIIPLFALTVVCVALGIWTAYMRGESDTLRKMR